MAIRPSALARMVGARIVALRSVKGMTQERLAWEAGLQSKGYLSRIERGDRLPSLHVLEQLAARLDVEVRDLFIFPERSELDAAMEHLRLGGPEAVRRVLDDGTG